MDDQRWKGNWNDIKGQAREQWAKLTDDDLDQARGKAEQLVGRLQERYGYTKDKAESEFRSFLDRFTS